jgi:hypothetical protein
VDLKMYYWNKAMYLVFGREVFGSGPPESVPYFQVDSLPR